MQEGKDQAVTSAVPLGIFFAIYFFDTGIY